MRVLVDTLREMWTPEREIAIAHREGSSDAVIDGVMRVNYTRFQERCRGKTSVNQLSRMCECLLLVLHDPILGLLAWRERFFRREDADAVGGWNIAPPLRDMRRSSALR